MFNSSRLLGHLLKSGVRQTTSSVGMGSKAAIGLGALGVAWAAYEHFSKKQEEGQATATPGSGPPPVPSSSSAASPSAAPSSAAPPPLPPQIQSLEEETPQQHDEATLLIQAMISAANADGSIDANERVKILRSATNAGIDEQSREFLQAELDTPIGLDQLIQRTLAAASADLSQQVYAASLTAIRVDNQAERDHLGQLAERLNLSDELVANIHQQLGVS